MIPPAVMRLFSLLTRRFPDPLLVALLPRTYRFDLNEVPGPPERPDGDIRLYVAPVNWAGQAWQWARAAERHIPGVGAVTMAYRLKSGFDFPVDVSVPVGAFVLSGRWQREQRRAVLENFTHVLVEAERHVFGRVYDQSVQQQVREITEAGLRVAMLCHGSDIRVPSRDAAQNPWSPFRDGLLGTTAVLEKQAQANRQILREAGASVFVSTPDLLLDVPEGNWLPVVVDTAVWATDTPLLERERPVVVHAPSSGIMKGSDLVDPVLERLHEEGVVEYRRIRGVPPGEMPAVYRDADVVLDQFRLGSYGVAACEAMAAARIVVGHVSEQTREFVRQTTGLDLPVVEATGDSIEAVIRDIAAHPESYRALGDAGERFVGTVHDGRMSAEALRVFLSIS